MQNITWYLPLSKATKSQWYFAEKRSNLLICRLVAAYQCKITLGICEKITAFSESIVSLLKPLQRSHVFYGPSLHHQVVVGGPVEEIPTAIQLTARY